MSKAYTDSLSTRIRCSNSTNAEDQLADAAPELLAACKALMKCKLVGGTIGEAHYHIPDSVRQQAVQAMEKAIGLESVVRAAIALATKNEG